MYVCAQDSGSKLFFISLLTSSQVYVERHLRLGLDSLKNKLSERNYDVQQLTAGSRDRTEVSKLRGDLENGLGRVRSSVKHLQDLLSTPATSEMYVSTLATQMDACETEIESLKIQQNQVSERVSGSFFFSLHANWVFLSFLRVCFVLTVSRRALPGLRETGSGRGSSHEGDRGVSAEDRGHGVGVVVGAFFDGRIKRQVQPVRRGQEVGQGLCRTPQSLERRPPTGGGRVRGVLSHVRPHGRVE